MIKTLFNLLPLAVVFCISIFAVSQCTSSYILMAYVAIVNVLLYMGIVCILRLTSWYVKLKDPEKYMNNYKRIDNIDD